MKGCGSWQVGVMAGQRSPPTPLQESIPFAVIGSNTVVEAKGRRVRGRLYPWGIVEGNAGLSPGLWGRGHGGPVAARGWRQAGRWPWPLTPARPQWRTRPTATS